MKFFGKFPLFIIIISVLLVGCTSQQQNQQPPAQAGNQIPAGPACLQENDSCGYGTTPVNSIVANQSKFYGKCCQGFACMNGHCKEIGDGCAGSSQFCAYGPVNLAHYDTPTYYGECCEGDCVNGYCKPKCKTSGSCANNSDCCSGYYCSQDGTCAKLCMTSGPCTSNPECCSGYLCGPNMQCILEPRCIPNQGSCNYTGQCCAGLTCTDSLCSNTTCKWGTACNSTSECCAGLYCSQTGICNTQKCSEINGSCNTTEDCCFGDKCENSTCIKRTCATLNESCTSLSCCSNLTCMNSKCVTPCKISGICFKDSDCCPYYYCNPFGNCAKTSECIFEYASCTNSSQCCSGLVCTNSTCSKPCKGSGACSSNAECCPGFFCNASMQCTLQPQTPPIGLTCSEICTGYAHSQNVSVAQQTYPGANQSFACLMYANTNCNEPNSPKIQSGCCCWNCLRDLTCDSACKLLSYNSSRGPFASPTSCIFPEFPLNKSNQWCCCKDLISNYSCCDVLGTRSCFMGNLCPPGATKIGTHSSIGACMSNCTQPQQPNACTSICITNLGFDYGRNVSSFSQCALNESWRQSGSTLCCCGLNGPMSSSKCQQMASARTSSNPVGHTIYGYYSLSLNSTLQCRDFGISACSALEKVCTIWVVEYNNCCLYECA